MKKNALFIAVLPLLFLSSCQSEIKEPSLSDPSYSYKNSEAHISFKATSLSSFNLYEKEKGSETYEFIKKINKKSFVTSHYDSSFKVVALINNEEKSEYTLEIKSYLDGVFDNDNVKVFSPKDSKEDISNYVIDRYEHLRRYEWASERIEMLFLPGEYEDVTISLGYYMSARGLGYTPDDCLMNSLSVKNHPGTGNALINFWRSLENLSFKNDSQWAISQATSIRRSHFKGDLVLSDSEGGNGWSSGGYIANSKIDGNINPGSQQQFLMRNDEFSSWSHSNMNMVFEGCLGNIPSGPWYTNRTTTLENSLDIIEKPYLIFDEVRGYGFIVPEKKTNSSGYSWIEDNEIFIPLDQFYIANPNKDDASTINKALEKYNHLLFTPGIYDIDETIKVKKDNSIITGLGYATLSSITNLDKVMNVKARNARISSLLFQNESEIDNFLTIENVDNIQGNTLLSDLFFRVGGQSENTTSVDTALIIDQDYTICDHFWIWRADHGLNISYFENYARLGCVVNGDDVISHAMMVEHFFEYQLVWNGERGQLIFYQSETPYDVPGQSYWMRNDEGLVGDEINGYPSYKINDNVIDHKGYGIGIYYVNTTNKHIRCYTGLECPANNDIYLLHVSARHFAGDGQIYHTINGIEGYKEGQNLTIELFDKTTYPGLFGND